MDTPDDEVKGLANVTKSAAIAVSRRRFFKGLVAVTAAVAGFGLLKPLAAKALNCTVCFGPCASCSSNTGSCCNNGFCFSGGCSCACGTCGCFKARETVCEDGSHSVACISCTC